MTESQALKFMARLGAFWPNVPDVTLQAYASELLDCRAEAVSLAIDAMVRECRFFPSLAEILDYVQSVSRPVAVAALPAPRIKAEDVDPAVMERFGRLSKGLQKGLRGEALLKFTTEDAS